LWEINSQFWLFSLNSDFFPTIASLYLAILTFFLAILTFFPQLRVYISQFWLFSRNSDFFPTIASLYLAILTFFSQLWDINLRVITTNCDIDSQFWLFSSQFWLCFPHNCEFISRNSNAISRPNRTYLTSQSCFCCQNSLTSNQISRHMLSLSKLSLHRPDLLYTVSQKNFQCSFYPGCSEYILISVYHKQ